MPAPSAPHRAHGLEWFPAISDQPPPSHPRPSAPPLPSAPGPKPRPLVVILPWMWAARAALARHVALYHSLGCDVAVFHGWPALSVWLPPLARRNALVLLTALSTHLREQGPRDVVLVCCSGAAKGVLCPLLERLLPGAAAAAAAAATATGGGGEATQSAVVTGPRPPASRNHLRFLLSFIPGAPMAVAQQLQQQPPQPAKRQPPPPQPNPAAALLLGHLRGVLFDSGPVDFDSSVGVRLFANARQPALRALQAAAGAAAAGALDFCLYEAFESQRRAMWSGLRRGLAAAGLPVAFLYSWSGDALANPQPIHALAVALREDAAAATAAAAQAPEGAGGRAKAAAAAAGVNAAARPAAGAGAGASHVIVGGAARSKGQSGRGGGSGNMPLAGGTVGSQYREHWPTLSSGSSSSSSSGSSISGSSSSDDGDGVAPTTGDPGQQRLAFPAGPNGSGGSSGAASPPLHASAPVVCDALGARHAYASSAAAVAAGVRVWEQGWDASPHVAHLREHPEQYRRVVSTFLEGCIGGARRGAGESGAAGSADAGVGAPASR